jgi:hypothetical protein
MIYVNPKKRSVTSTLSNNPLIVLRIVSQGRRTTQSSVIAKGLIKATAAEAIQDGQYVGIWSSKSTNRPLRGNALAIYAKTFSVSGNIERAKLENMAFT